MALPDSYDLNSDHVVLGDNLQAIAALPDGCADLVYIDPPFNTGRKQARRRVRSAPVAAEGKRVGFYGREYGTEIVSRSSYDDRFDDFQEFLRPRLVEARRILKDTGSFFLHIDYRESHYCKVALDELFGRPSFMNEIVWAYDYGGRAKKRWSAKHDSIFWYAVNPDNYTFDFDAMDRIPYMAPGLVTKEKAARGKTPTDVWWHTIVSPNAKERTGYATQKPLGVLERLIKVHSKEGDLVVDFFAGSGTTAEAAAKNGRRFWVADESEEAFGIMLDRLAPYGARFHQ